jgi:hypothetical protein
MCSILSIRYNSDKAHFNQIIKSKVRMNRMNLNFVDAGRLLCLKWDPQRHLAFVAAVGGGLSRTNVERRSGMETRRLNEQVKRTSDRFPREKKSC